MDKFFRGQRVRVCKKMPPEMKHFTHNCDAIIDNCNGEMQYGLLLLTDTPATSSWYREDQLKLISDDRVGGEYLLQYFNHFKSAKDCEYDTDTLSEALKDSLGKNIEVVFDKGYGGIFFDLSNVDFGYNIVLKNNGIWKIE